MADPGWARAFCGRAAFEHDKVLGVSKLASRMIVPCSMQFDKERNATSTPERKAGVRVVRRRHLLVRCSPSILYSCFSPSRNSQRYDDPTGGDNSEHVTVTNATAFLRFCKTFVPIRYSTTISASPRRDLSCESRCCHSASKVFVHSCSGRIASAFVR